MANGLGAGFRGGFQMASEARARRNRTALLRQEQETEAEQAAAAELRESLKTIRQQKQSIIEQATNAISNVEDPERAEEVREVFRRKFQAVVMQEAQLLDTAVAGVESTGQAVPENVPTSREYIDRELSAFDTTVGTVPTASEQREREVRSTEAEAEARARGQARGTPQEPGPVQEGVDAQGNPVFFRTLPNGQTQIIPGVSPGGDERIVRSNVDVITQDGGRIPAIAETRGDQVFVADPQGEFRPLQEVHPNAVRVEQPRTRTQEIPTDRQPFTREEFVGVSAGTDVSMEAGVGPFDAAAGALIGVPAISQLFTEIAGEGAGEEQRKARLVFEDLNNRIAVAFRPSEDGRISNQQLSMAQRVAPSFGAFANETGTRRDLLTLRGIAERRLENELQIANNPERYDSSIVRDAQGRLQALGEVITLTNALLEVSESVPEVEIPQTLGKPPEKLTEADIRRIPDRWDELSPNSQRQLIESLSDEQAETLDRAFQERDSNG